MEEIKSVIEFLEKIRTANVKTFDSCPEEKLLRDTDYNNLYQAFWLADFRLKNVISLLKCVEESSKQK